MILSFLIVVNLSSADIQTDEYYQSLTVCDTAERTAADKNISEVEVLSQSVSEPMAQQCPTSTLLCCSGSIELVLCVNLRQ